MTIASLSQLSHVRSAVAGLRGNKNNKTRRSSPRALTITLAFFCASSPEITRVIMFHCTPLPNEVDSVIIPQSAKRFHPSALTGWDEAMATSR